MADEKHIQLIDELRLALQRSKRENAELISVLRTVESMANGVREFNYPCERIYNIIHKGLEGK